jgi:hypothetical protein
MAAVPTRQTDTTCLSSSLKTEKLGKEVEKISLDLVVSNRRISAVDSILQPLDDEASVLPLCYHAGNGLHKCCDLLHIYSPLKNNKALVDELVSQLFNFSFLVLVTQTTNLWMMRQVFYHCATMLVRAHMSVVTCYAFMLPCRKLKLRWLS